MVSEECQNGVHVCMHLCVCSATCVLWIEIVSVSQDRNGLDMSLYSIIVDQVLI